MNIHISYDPEFVTLMETLKAALPAELFEIDGIGSQLDLHQSSKLFFNYTDKPTADHSVDANANVSGRDVITYNYEVPKPLMKLNSYYNLWKTIRELEDIETADEVIIDQLAGAIYINDVWDIGRPYCFNYSTYDIALEGLKMGSRLDIKPAKGLSSFLRQIEQFTVYAANSTLGATGLADLLIVASWYVDRIYETGRDHKIEVSHTKTYVKELLTSLIYTLNWEFRGNQSPFTNVSIYDRKFLEELAPAYLINGVAPNVDTIVQVQEWFLEAYRETLQRDPITFPVLTACFSINDDNEIQDEEFLELIAKENLPFGHINIYCGKTSTLSSCCRLRSDIESIGYSNTFGAGGTKIGSLGVVTLNLPRMANETMEYVELALTDGVAIDPAEAFLRELEHMVRRAGLINHAKRTFIGKRIKRGSLPLYTLGLMDLKKQFSTCGFTGLYEACRILGYDILTEEGQEFARKILDTINTVNTELTRKYGYPHNMEQVPGETSSVKLAQKDKICGCNPEDIPFYSNQFIPLVSQADMLERIKLQGMFDSHCTGGAICHLNVNEQISSWEKLADLIKWCAKSGVIYWAVNYALGKCPNGHGMSVVKQDTPACPTCGALMEVFTRVVGFLTNTKHWSYTRRKHDWPNRKFYRSI